MDPDDIKLPDELKPRLYAAVDALLVYPFDAAPLHAFLTEDRGEHLTGGFPDLWRHVAFHLSGIAPEAVPPKLRFAVKHGCYFLLLHGASLEEGFQLGAAAVRELLQGLKVTREAPR